MQHEALEHLTKDFWPCTSCDDSFTALKELQTHQAEHDAPHPRLLSQRFNEERLERAVRTTACHLCHKKLASVKAYVSHVGKHLERIALAALPQEDDEVDHAHDIEGSWDQENQNSRPGTPPLPGSTSSEDNSHKSGSKRGWEWDDKRNDFVNCATGLPPLITNFSRYRVYLTQLRRTLQGLSRPGFCRTASLKDRESRRTRRAAPYTTARRRRSYKAPPDAS